MNNAELLKKIDSLETSGMKTTRQWYDIWSEAMRYFFSDHDRNLRKHDDWDFIVMNYIWPSSMQEIAKLSKNSPKIIAQPWSEDDADAAEVWQNACQWQWQGPLKMRKNQIAAVLCGKIFGYRVSKIYWEDKCSWDDNEKKWVGDIRYKLWHPAFFWADGDESVDDGNCGTVRWVTLEYAQTRWPKFKKEFERIAVSSKESNDASSGEIKFRSWISAGALTQSDGDSDDDGNAKKIKSSRLMSLIRGGDNKDNESDSDVKMVRISECYFKDYEEVHQKEERDMTAEEVVAGGLAIQGMDNKLYDAATGELFGGEKWPTIVTREWDEPKYPYGRYVLSAGEGDERIILNPDYETQRWPFKRWPFVVTPHYLLPFMWQGLNAVSLYKSTQDMINISVSHMVNNLKQFGDPRIAVEDGAIALNPKTKKAWTIRSGAGALLRLVKGGLNRYRIEPPMPISPAAAALYDLFSQEFKNLTGLQAISLGQQLKSGTTATEAQHLAISSNDRIFLQSVYEDEWVKELAGLMAEIMQANYDEGRWVRIVGEDKFVGIHQITSREKSAKYDMTVEPGTTLPFDEEKRIAKYEKAYALLANPTANPMLPEMLRVLDIPNRKKILAELPAYQKYIAFIQLYEQVKAGQIAPEQAVEMLIQAAMQEFGAGQAGNGGQAA